MPKRRKGPAARLSSFMTVSRFPRYFEPKLSLRDDPERWIEAAKGALNTAELDPHIKIAFERFKLDPDNPYDWNFLLFNFAVAHFARRGKAGRPNKWGGAEWCDLLGDYFTFRSNNPALKTKEAACRAMAKDKALSKLWGSKYKTLSRNVSRALGKASNPYIEIVERSTRLLHSKQTSEVKMGGAWSQADEWRTRARACELAKPAIAALIERAKR